jgi:hypothetical protein
MKIRQQGTVGGVRIQMTTFTQADADIDIEANHHQEKNLQSSRSRNDHTGTEESMDDDKHAAL